MPLDPILVPLLQGYSETPLVIDDYDAFRTRSRANVDGLIRQLAEPGPDVARVSDVELPVEGGSVTLRIYRPESDVPLPIHLYLHGGGFVIGSIFDLSTDITCRERAALAQQVVIAVNYRKSPEHKFPVPLNDCYAALQWAAEHATETGGSDVLSIGGGSAGANLAAGVALKARDEQGPTLALQLLEVPVLDLTFRAPSYGEFGSGYALSTWDIECARRDYLASDADRTHPYASPLDAPDLTGLPPAVIFGAEFDVLVDDGPAYAQRLRDAGVPARFLLREGQVHVSSSLTAILPAAREWRADVIGALREFTGPRAHLATSEAVSA